MIVAVVCQEDVGKTIKKFTTMGYSLMDALYGEPQLATLVFER